jgi:hypothetical protein
MLSPLEMALVVIIILLVVQVLLSLAIFLGVMALIFLRAESCIKALQNYLNEAGEPQDEPLPYRDPMPRRERSLGW